MKTWIATLALACAMLVGAPVALAQDKAPAASTPAASATAPAARRHAGRRRSGQAGGGRTGPGADAQQG